MNLDRRLICGLLFDDELALSDRVRLVQAHHEFEKANEPVLRFVLDHYGEYGKTPDIETLEEKYPSFPFQANKEPFEFYVVEAQKAKRLRHMRTAVSDLEKTLATGDVDAAITKYYSSAKELELGDLKSQDVKLTSSVSNQIDEYILAKEAGNTQGIPTGFSQIDEDTYGIQKGEFWVLAGRPRNYKSWILCRMAQMAVQYENIQKPVLFFSKEMTKIQIQHRIMALVGECSFREVRRHQLEVSKLREIEERIKKAFRSEFIIIGRDMKMKYDEGYIHSKILEYDAEVAYVDGLYLMADDTEWSDHTSLSRNVRDVALQTECGIVGTVQFSKAGTTLDNIAYSDSYAQDASVVLGAERIMDTTQKKLTKSVRLKTLKVRDDESDRTMVISVGFKRSRFIEGAIDDPDADDSGDWFEEDDKDGDI